MSRLGFVIVLASTSAACSAGLSDRETTALRAADSARTNCDAQVLDEDRVVVDPSLVASVNPLYARVHSGRDSSARLLGAEIRLRSPDGLNPTQVDRVLECHAARRALGLAVSPLPSDPFATAVNIDVRADHSLYVVRLTAPDLDAARRTLALARAYASDGRDIYASAAH